MLIKGNFVDLFRREIYPAEIRLRDNKIASVERKESAPEKYILPGFIDAHVHIESSMLIPSEFSKIALKHGTIAVVSDPHEIANVLGIEGVEYMLENAREADLKIFFGAPSCVPATDFESSGSRLDSDKIEALIKRDDIYFLSEMMNYPGVIYRDKEVMRKLELARKYKKPIDGHAPGLRGGDLRKYSEGGISTDHEAFSLEEAEEKIARGMKILIREGSAARNLEALAPLFNRHPEMLMLCCDDIHPEMLLNRHIDGPVKELLSKGYNVFDVLRAASVNPVNHYNINVGLLREGDSADFIIVGDLVDFRLIETWIEGKNVFPGLAEKVQSTPRLTPNVFVSAKLKEGDITIKNRKGNVRIIEVEDGELYTKSSLEKWSDMPVLVSDTERDILKIVVKDRYVDGPAKTAFIRGFGIKEGAMASSVAHDSHNIIAVGADDDSIVQAINSVIDNKGGLAICRAGKTETLPLPVAGIMSDVPCGTIADKYLDLSDKVKIMGSYLKAPFMTLSFMSLLVIPELKLGDRGLFDGLKFEFTDLFVEEA